MQGEGLPDRRCSAAFQSAFIDLMVVKLQKRQTMGNISDQSGQARTACGCSSRHSPTLQNLIYRLC